MNQRLQPTERFEETSRFELPLIQPLTDHADERNRHDTDTTSATVSRYGITTERAWWQEQINGPRGVRLSAALCFGLLHTLSALISPVSILLTYLLTYALLSGQLVYNIASTAIALVPAIATGYLLRRIAPRNAVPGAAIAAGIALVLILLRGILSYWQWVTTMPPAYRGQFAPLWQILLSLLPAIVMVLTVVGLEKRERYKRSRER